MLIGFPLNVDVDMLTLSSLNVGTYVDMLCDHNGIESRQKSPSGAPYRGQNFLRRVPRTPENDVYVVP